MRGRASHITAFLAVLTIVAIVTTGIALGLIRNGGPWVMLLGPARSAEAPADARPIAEGDSQSMVAADPGVSLTDDGRTRLRPDEQSASVESALRAEETSTVVVERSGRAPAVSHTPSIEDSSPHGSTEPEAGSGTSDPPALEEGQPLSEVEPAITPETDESPEDPSRRRTVSESEAMENVAVRSDRLPTVSVDEEDEHGDDEASEAGPDLE